jgi:hypothetical protein
MIWRIRKAGNASGKVSAMINFLPGFPYASGIEGLFQKTFEGMGKLLASGLCIINIVKMVL